MIINIFFRETEEDNKEDSLTISLSTNSKEKKSLKAKSLPLDRFSEEEQKLFQKLIEIVDRHKNVDSIEANYSL